MGKLFIGGIIPGLTLATVYALFIIVRAILNPAIMPTEERRYSRQDRLKAILELAPVLALISVILGSIYMGLATPTEAAAIGVTGAVLIALGFKSLSLKRWFPAPGSGIIIILMVIRINKRLAE